MTNTPKRRKVTAIQHQSSRGFWSTVSAYATELAPVAGPLLEYIGHTANAIDSVQRQTRFLEAQYEELEGE